jgi:hypothetical protein
VNSEAMPCENAQTCSAIIIAGGRFSFGRVAQIASDASRSTPKARSLASRRPGVAEAAIPASNMAA